MVARGYASETFLHSSGRYMAAVKKPCFVYHFGDFDPSGQDAARAVEEAFANMLVWQKYTSNGSR